MSEESLELLNLSDSRAFSESEERDPNLPLLPILAFIAVWLGGSTMIVGVWLHPVLPGGWLFVAALLILALLPLRSLIRGLQGFHYPSRATRLLILRPFWYAMLFAPLLALATLAGALAGLPFGAGGALGRWASGGGALLLTVAALAGYIGSRRLQIRRLEVRLPRLPRSFDGLRVVQISDLHVGPHTSRRFLERISTAIREAKPDLIAITGDQVDDFAADIESFREAFADLSAPLGTVAVVGNHDVYAGWQAVRHGLTEAGISVLVNESVAIERAGMRLWIAGTGDPAAEGWPQRHAREAAPDIARTLSEVPAGEPVLVLAHNPALWPSLAERGVDLTLSGHTHYGQFAVPSRGWSMASPFLDLAMGWHQQGGSILYIHPGTNYWGVPFRIGTPPEVTVLTLRTGIAEEVRSI